MSTLRTQRVSRSLLSVPYHGSARADVLLEGGAVPAIGPAMLTLADLAMTGTIIRADFDAPDLPRAVWVNGAAWELALPRRSYQSAAGVRLSTVLRDLLADVATAAALAGYPAETFAATPPDRPLEKWYLRRGGVTGRDVLIGLLRAGYAPPWWIDASGATRFDARPSGAATARADVMRRNAEVGVRAFGLDSPASFLPGTSLEGVPTRRLIVREAASALTAEAWA